MSFFLLFGRYRCLILERVLLIGLFFLLWFCKVFRFVNRLCIVCFVILILLWCIFLFGYEVFSLLSSLVNCFGVVFFMVLRWSSKCWKDLYFCGILYRYGVNCLLRWKVSWLLWINMWLFLIKIYDLLDNCFLILWYFWE